MARFAMEILQRTHHMKGMASTASLSDAPPQAAAALPNPIRAVIFSHSHSDHFGGVGGIVTPEQVARRLTMLARHHAMTWHSAAEFPNR